MNRNVTVIVPTKNSVKYLLNALQSIINDISVSEILILDSSSNDGTQNIVNKLPKTRLIDCGEMSLPEALNHSINEVHTKYVARMDADDIALPGRFFLQREFLELWDFDLVGSDFSYIGKYSSYLNYIKNRHFTSSNLDVKLIYKSAIVHPTWFMKTELLSRIRYRTQLAEDYDFLVRAKMSGARFGVIDKVLLYYRLSELQSSKTKSVNMLRASAVISNIYVDWCSEISGNKDVLVLKDKLFKDIYNSEKLIISNIELISQIKTMAISEMDLKEIFHRMLFRLSPDFDLKRLYLYILNQFGLAFALDCLPMIFRMRK